MTETWLPVIGFEGYYEVSDQGRVRSVTRIVAGKEGRPRVAQGLILRPGTDRGYGGKRVSLGGPGGRQTRKVHRMVLESFVGLAPDGMVCCHNDGDPSNNRLENLRWDTPSANMLDRVKHGTDPNVQKTHCPRGHEYAGRNLIRRSGRRHCRECSNAASREYHRSNKPDLSRLTHGRVGTYSRGGCRCEDCKSAARMWRMKRRQGVLE